LLYVRFILFCASPGYLLTGNQRALLGDGMPFGADTVLSIADEKWSATRTALKETSERFAAVLSAVADSPAPTTPKAKATATAGWSVLLARFAERDLRVLSRVLLELVDQILESSAAADAAQAIP
jgi:hypothetical protein